MRRTSDAPAAVKPLRLIDAARDELMDIPAQARRDFGYDLFLVQTGDTPNNASPFEGSSGATIMKLVQRHDSDTYRCVYTAKFEQAIYVLHVFKKKSTSGIATPRREIETVNARFKLARELYEQEFEAAKDDAQTNSAKGKR
jgi:phage-related protein